MPSAAAAEGEGTSVAPRFRAALDALVTALRADRTVLAAILCGSLSHDTVWARSDIDLVLVVEDERGAATRGVALWADGVNAHAMLLSRAAFRAAADGARGQSFLQTYLAKGRLLYTHDDTLAELLERVRHVGARDSQLSLLRAGIAALPSLYKARKWLVTRDDLEYSALWTLYAATPIAQIALISRGILADREVIPQAARVEPALFATIYTDLLNAPKTPERVEEALAAAEGYVAARADALFGLVLEHLRDVGEARACTEIEAHFERTLGVRGVTGACEYLADLGRIGKAALPVRLTKRSSAPVQELAFYAID